jgi:hypothetical protein
MACLRTDLGNGRREAQAKAEAALSVVGVRSDVYRPPFFEYETRPHPDDRDQVFPIKIREIEHPHDERTSRGDWSIAAKVGDQARADLRLLWRVAYDSSHASLSRIRRVIISRGKS